MANKESLCEEKLLVYESLTRSCDIIKQWVDKFSLFYSIQSNERDRLYSNCLLEQLVFRTALRLDGDRVVLCSGIVVHKVQINYLLGDVAQQIYEYGSILKTHKIDSIITATLASILLLDSNNHGNRKEKTNTSNEISFLLILFEDYVYHRTAFSSIVTELYQKIVDSLKDYLKQQHEDASVYLQFLERLNDARRIAHNLRKRLLLYRHTTGLTSSTNTLLDLVYEERFSHARKREKNDFCSLDWNPNRFQVIYRIMKRIQPYHLFNMNYDHLICLPFS